MLQVTPLELVSTVFPHVVDIWILRRQWIDPACEADSLIECSDSCSPLSHIVVSVLCTCCLILKRMYMYVHACTIQTLRFEVNCDIFPGRGGKFGVWTEEGEVETYVRSYTLYLLGG